VTVGVRPAEDQPIGLWKHLRVAVSGAEASDHDLAVMHFHRLPLGISVGDRLERRSNGLLDGAVIAEQLVDSDGVEGGVVTPGRELVGGM